MTAMLPQGACDCHLHVFERGYALAPMATFTPPLAPATRYREVQRALGLQRAVVVQPTGYGFDNACTQAAVAELAQGGMDARGVATVPLSVSDEELDQLHQSGIRGVRFMMLPGGLLPWSHLEPMAVRLAARGWHINLQLNGHELPQHEPMLLRLPCRLAIDHIGKFLGPVDTQNSAFASLRRILDHGKAWIKLSAPYESSGSGPPGYTDIAPLVQALAASHPERCLWASNWPHLNVMPVPSNSALLDWTLRLAGDAPMRQRLLVDNPAELYGFEAL
ncbi:MULTISPECIES: amidohydrolase [unclassified Polaromonas]|uniref:amidohydrolase family protein n=2 Tax=Polaromonas TaxID=52972 RepID=UPI001A2AB3BA|nr:MULTISPECIES: amidohydrolase family protein [unclassified Polaromonas]MBG6073673.1 D-galactarolactone isomerase [Polaromonas sp. CG_9.7]MBG6115675.1 D-galactarolactone isomerase [Polaromonas sp. CG_9.2]MDH6186619.1 D-galactarolactone isomerase [Polaromonas sp. CG_23.6]